jgi:orotidine-5'-phosphate decarboxylase
VSSRSMTNPVFVALDVDTPERALELVRQTRAFVGGFKVGPRLSLRFGEPLLKEIAKHGHMFLDNKFFDIPNTMESAVRAAFDCGATYCTVHAQAGREALTRLSFVEKELNDIRPFRLLAVTVLTSFNQESLPSVSRAMPIAEQAKALASLALESGLSGIVCSPDEVESLRAAFPSAFLVTPGVRLSQDDRGDQQRTADPKTALRRGASALVVGRPIVDAPDPALAAKAFYEEIQKA